jgi:hypothetical protein
VYDSNQINHSRKLSIFLNDAASALTAHSPDFRPIRKGRIAHKQFKDGHAIFLFLCGPSFPETLIGQKTFLRAVQKFWSVQRPQAIRINDVAKKSNKKNVDLL